MRVIVEVSIEVPDDMKSYNTESGTGIWNIVEDCLKEYNPSVLGIYE